MGSKLAFLGLWSSQEVLPVAVHEEEVSHTGLKPWMGQEIGLGSNPGTTTSHLIFSEPYFNICKMGMRSDPA